MSTTFTIDTSTSRAHPTPAPMKRLTVPAIQRRKVDGTTAEPLVMLTAYTVRMAQLLDPHCDLLLVGDSLGQVVYGLPSTLPVTLDMMIAHGAAVVRGSYHAVVAVDMPFGSYEASPEHAFASAARVLAETGCAAIKMEGGAAMAPTIRFLTERGIPVMAHVGLTPQAINALGGYGARGRGDAEEAKILADAEAVAAAGAFSTVVEGVVEPLARRIAESSAIPVIGIGASAACDGQVLVAEDMLGLFERTPRFVKRFDDMAGRISDAAARYAAEVRARTFPGDEQVYAVKG
ncbi:3-methyl-2-oxobutanoate hydroxymethyltransferase [Sphingomonas sp.]|jgi:3-methyl-2-oxobutanoate hydroxymethyltransferase|uniref:3-methyl-2-oxobutanoate hydroxymethyltransferase n=1 Tax=Sphingomonas sp. TaxID=28214 RepID=UPI002E35AFEE|nr:3-methyl-2-oxobutanoate hydroxymethyltransferase [Sphingomonas sp.]HEX4694875.1 3-methyl-2-oxobutanoate hydroxymethyltransferase [Sphingomonas sp.]